MPPGQPDPHTPPRHRGRDLAAMAMAVIGVVLVLYGAFAAALALGCAVLGALLVGCGVVLGYEPTGDHRARPPGR